MKSRLLSSGPTLLATVLLCIFSALTIAGEPGHIQLIEAEDFQSADNSWLPIDHMRKRYNAAPSGLRMLSGSFGGAGEATKAIDIPHNGKFTLWVHYMDSAKAGGPTEIQLQQADRTIAQVTINSKTARDTHEARIKWGGGPAQFVWQPIPVTLNAGQANIRLLKKEPIKVGQLDRLIDAFVLTDQVDVQPSVKQFLKPLYVRFRILDGQKEPCAIHISGQLPSRPWHLPRHNVTNAGMTKGFHDGLMTPADKAAFFKAGDASAWINVVPLLNIVGENRVVFSAIQKYFHPLDEAHFAVDISNTPSEEGLIRSTKRTGPGGGLQVSIDLTDRQNIMSDLDWSSHSLSVAKSFPTPPGKPANRFPMLTGNSITQERYQQTTFNNEMQTMRLLGLSGIGSHPSYREQGFANAFVACTNWWTMRGPGGHAQMLEDKIDENLNAYADQWKQSGVADDLIVVKLFDEPNGPTLDQITRPKIAHEKFRAYLQSLGYTPTDFGAQDWNAIAPTKNRSKAKLFYHTQRFRYHTAAEAMRVGTESLGRHLPSVPTAVNYGEFMTYSGNALRSGIDWFLVQRTGALSMGWTEDWLNHSATYQLCGYRAAFLRAACRYRDQKFGMYCILRRPWDIKTKAATEIGQGAKAIFFYNYGPRYAGSSDAHSTRDEIYKPIAEVSHAVGAVEDVLLDAMPVQTDIALHYSQATDIWSEEKYSTPGNERMCLYLLLRHLGHAPDILTEDDIAEGALTDRKMLFLLGSHIHEKAIAPLADWVREGGILYIAADTGRFDQLNRSQDIATVFGFTKGQLDYRRDAGRGYFEYARHTAMDTVETDVGKLPAYCLQHSVAAENAKVIGKFSNGDNALISKSVGKGSVIIAGFHPGLAYIASGSKARTALWDQLRAENRLGDIVTYNPLEYDSAPRILFENMLTDYNIQPRITVSNPLVEASHLTGPRGDIIVLSNYSGRPIEDLRLTIKSPLHDTPTSVRKPIQVRRLKDSHLELTMDIDAIEFVQFEK